MLIAQKLLLLGLDPTTGKIVNSAREQLKVALAGALIAELGLAGAVQVQGKSFVVVQQQIADPLLNQALGAIGTGRTKGQLKRVGKATRPMDACASRLVASGTVGMEARKLFQFYARYPVRDRGLRDELVRHMRNAATGPAPTTDVETAVLLALAGPGRLLEVVAPERSTRGVAKQRIKEASETVPAAAVVKAVIAETQAAIAAATAAGAVAASS